MIRVFAVLGMVLLWSAGAVHAQLSAPNKAGVTMGHLHYHVRDVEANKKFWIALGGKPINVGATEVIKFPGVLIFLTQAESSAGDRIELFQELTENARFVLDPGRAHAVAERHNRPMTDPIASHHIHIYTPEGADGDAMSWYVRKGSQRYRHRVLN
jgi:hypothetical protein